MTVIKKFLRLTFGVIDAAKKDNVGIYSAQAAFFVTISFVPFIMLLLSMVKFLPISQEMLIEWIVSVFPKGTKNLISSFIAETYEKSGAAVISITAVSTLWASSIGVHSMVKGINKVFCASETRGYLRMRLMSMIYTLLVMALLILCLGFLVFGNTIAETVSKIVPRFSGAALIIMSIRMLVAIIVLGMFFVIMYTVVPDRKTKLLTQLPGAMLSSIGWVGFSNAFSYYYENLSDYSYLYGSLSVLVFFMLWLFVCIYMLFIGAEINKIIEKERKNA